MKQAICCRCQKHLGGTVPDDATDVVCIACDVRTIVFANLQDALDNGHFDRGEHLDGATAEEIADDMIALAYDCDGMEASMMVPFIREWLEQNG